MYNSTNATTNNTTNNTTTATTTTTNNSNNNTLRAARASLGRSCGRARRTRNISSLSLLLAVVLQYQYYAYL